MDDAAYRRLFAYPRMVRDLIEGFVGRDWSGELDLDTLTSVPSSYVGERFQERYGDAVWRVQFLGKPLYLMVMLEFQTTVDAGMAVRMLTYTGLLYGRLMGEGAFRGRGTLPPVLPVVIYSREGRWTAATELREMIAPVGKELTAYQPRQQYCLVHVGGLAREPLPTGNLMAVLIGLEGSREPGKLGEWLKALEDLLRREGDEGLMRAFVDWVYGLLMPRRYPEAADAGPLESLKEVRTMLAERVKEWTAEWVKQGREEGREEGHAEERALLCRLAARKFDGDTAERLSELLEGEANAEMLAQVGEWIIECRTGGELLGRLAGASTG